MDKNTLYYTFSTIPQVLAAISAILAVFLFRRLETLQNLLIGDGQSILNRSDSGDYDSLFRSDVDKKNKNIQDRRLRDYISRKNIIEIKKVIDFYHDQENQAERNGQKVNKETGFAFAYEKYILTEKLINTLKKMSLITFIVSFVSILLSVVSLACTEYIYSNCISKITIIINLLFFGLALFLTVYVVLKSFKTDAPHEK